MKRPIVSIGAVVLTAGVQSLLGGPVAIDTKDAKLIPAPVVEEPCNWTGFYLGVHGGYAWGDLTLHEVTDVPNDNNPFYHPSQDSFFGGGQIGFNYQWGSWFVIGVEGEFSAGDFSDSDRIEELSPDSEVSIGSADGDWFASASGRVGVSFWRNRLLGYLKGGVVFTEFDYKVNDVSSDELWKGEHDRTGGLVGTGLEYAFNCHWTVKLEYQHYFFDDDEITARSFFGSSPGGRKTHEVTNQDIDSIRTGLNFKF